MRGGFTSGISLTETAPDRAALVVFAAAALLFFARLNIPLQEPDEIRYAEVSRQMLETHSVLMPVLHGEPYLDKPPLIYWLVMASYGCFGVHDWSARLVSCTTAFLAVPLTWWWARRTLGRHAALAAATVLALSGRFLQLGRLLTPDSLLCLWVLLSWMGIHLALAGPKGARGAGRDELAPATGWWILSACACALGILTKGPVALVLVLVPAIIWQRLGGIRPPRWKHIAVWFFVGLGLAAPWYIVACVREPAFLEYFFWKHNVLRFVAPFVHAKPFWFYLPEVLLGTLPWSLALPGLAMLFLRRSSSPASDAAVQCRRAMLLCVLGFAWCLLFFSCSGSKRATYLLPCFPPLALALGGYINHVLSRPDRRWARYAWQSCRTVVFAVLFAGVHFLLPDYADRFSLRNQVQEHTAKPGEVAPEVICFPHHWDSVSYYLRRQDVRAYSAEQTAPMVRDLQARPATLVFLKPGAAVEQFLRALPDELEFVPVGRPGLVVKGWVRQRPRWSDFPLQTPDLAAKEPRTQ